MANEFRKRGLQSLENTSLWACFGRLVNYKDNTPASHDSLAMNIGFFFTAGYETTAHLINWALFELAANPAIQVTSYTVLHFNKYTNMQDKTRYNV